MLAVILLCLLIALVFNVGVTISSKLHVQNASDSIAYSNAVWMGRGMNAVTTSNHLMGELSALYVLHHALGADRLDERKVTPMPWYLRPKIIKGAYRGLGAVADIPPQEPGNVADKVMASEESTLWQAKRELKLHLMRAYLAHAVGVAVAKFPPTSALGIAMQQAAVLYQLKVKQEYLFLDMVEGVAVALIQVKTQALPRLLKALNAYTDYVHAAAVPLATSQVTSAVATEHEVIGTTPPAVQLPLVREKLGRCGAEREKRAQLMRAAYPWVHYWRKPLLDAFGFAAPLSKARSYYMKYTNEYSGSIIREFRRRPGQRCSDPKHPERSLGLRLYVIDGLDPPRVDKTQEEWAKHKPASVAQADRMFCVLGLARQKKPDRVSAAPFFRQANPDGVVCFAQAMVYNANPQRRARRYRASSRYQPVAGWDTLNWDQDRNRVVEFKSTSYSPRRPHIKLNWQAKLVPVSSQQLSGASNWSYADSPSANVLNTRLGGAAKSMVLVNH